MLAAMSVLVLAGACGSDDPQDATEPTESPSASETAAEELVAAPGAVGPVKVGMTEEEANATGLFEPREVPDDDPCADEYADIQWKAPNTEALMVDVDDSGKISLLGIRDTVKTAAGIGVGSTWEDVQLAYGGAKLEESQASGSIIYLKDGDKWLGIAFAEESADVKDSSKVVFMEAAAGGKPATYLSGCSY
jgi:hypothetical protein